MLGNMNRKFLEKITPVLVCLMAAGIWHCLRAWQSGIYVRPEDFNGNNRSVMRKALKALVKALVNIVMALGTCTRMLNTWRSRRTDNQEAMMVIIKGQIRERVCVHFRVCILVTNYLLIAYATGNQEDDIPIEAIREDDEGLAIALAAIRRVYTPPVTLLREPNPHQRALPEESNEFVRAQLDAVEGIPESEESDSGAMRSGQ